MNSIFSISIVSIYQLLCVVLVLALNLQSLYWCKGGIPILKYFYFRKGWEENFKIERNAFSQYVLDLLVEQFAPYCKAIFSFFKITNPPT